MQTFSTEADIARLKAVDGKDTWFTDARTPGLKLIVSAATGRKTFYSEYRPPGSKNTTKRKLGLHTDTFNLKAARADAAIAKGELLSGKDPMPVPEPMVTVGSMIERYKEHKKPKPSAETIRILDKQIAPKLGNRDAVTLVTDDVTAWHSGFTKIVKVRDAKGSITEQIVPAPYAADRALDVLNALFNYSIRQKKPLPKGTENPCVGVERYFTQEGNKRHHEWTDDEIAMLAKKLSEYERIARAAPSEFALIGSNLRGKHGHFTARYPSLSTIFALRFLIFTGVRKNEALKLRWDQVKADKGVIVWTKYKAVTKQKQPKPMVRSITPPLAALLKDVDDFRSENNLNDNPHVFPGAKPGAHLIEIDGVWDGIRKGCGFVRTEDGKTQWARVHDLRHLLGDEAADLGLSDKEIAALLGHAGTRMVARYSHIRANRNAANAERLAAVYEKKLKAA